MAFATEIRYAISTLRATGPAHGITVLMHEALRGRAETASLSAWLQARGVTVRFVPGKGDVPRMYYYMKSYIWDMTQYDKVAFFDTDFLFVRKPDIVFDECKADFCAASHTKVNAASILLGEKRAAEAFQLASGRGELSEHVYFNAGFFVVVPSKERGAEVLGLWKRCHLGNENACLIRSVRGVQEMSPRFNLQHAEKNSSLVEAVRAVALHAKAGRLGCDVIERWFNRSYCGVGWP